MTTEVEVRAEAPGERPAAPRHVALIMDGNGRWAKRRGLPRLAGHRAGVKIIRDVVGGFAERGVEVLTLYAFSSENWTRPDAEVRGLLDLLAQAVPREVPYFHERNIRLMNIGREDRLSPGLRDKLVRARERTAGNTGLTLVVALDYGSRSELVRAARRLVASGASPEDVTEEAIARELYTGGLPDPDLIIRTSGEMRLSNFLLWQAAYAEIYTTQACWPDFDESELDRALADYASRQRRYGGL